MNEGKVWIVEYRHRHGVDFSAFSSSDDAFRAAAQIAADWVGREAPDAATEIRQHFADGDWAACIHAYTAATSEGLEVHELTLSMERWTTIPIVEVDSDIVHRSKFPPYGDGPGVTKCDRNYFWQGTQVSFPVGTRNFFAWMPKVKMPTTCLACLADVDG